MMTHPEASLYMTQVVDMAKRNALKFGYSFPVFAVMTKGRKHHVSINNEKFSHRATIIMRKFEMVESNQPDKEEYQDFDEIDMLLNSIESGNENPMLDADDEELVYITLIQTISDNTMDKFDNHNIARALAKDTDADCIGHVSSCIYKHYKDDDPYLEKGIQNDPDVVRVLYACYYINGDEKLKTCVTPFINRGEIFDTESFMNDNDVKYEILFGHSCWTNKPDNEDVRIKYPYGEKTYFDSLND